MKKIFLNQKNYLLIILSLGFLANSPILGSDNEDDSNNYSNIQNWTTQKKRKMRIQNQYDYKLINAQGNEQTENNNNNNYANAKRERWNNSNGEYRSARKSNKKWRLFSVRNNNREGISGGNLTVIIVIVAIILAAVGGFIYFLYRKMRGRKNNYPYMQPQYQQYPQHQPYYQYQEY